MREEENVWRQMEKSSATMLYLLKSSIAIRRLPGYSQLRRATPRKDLIRIFHCRPKNEREKNHEGLRNNGRAFIDCIE